jgi:hypothetical protein
MPTATNRFIVSSLSFSRWPRRSEQHRIQPPSPSSRLRFLKAKNGISATKKIIATERRPEQGLAHGEME